MGKKLHTVALTSEERQSLRALTTRGTVSARRVCRARVLLLASDGHSDKFITTAVGCSVATVERTRKRYCNEGLTAALSEKPRPGKPPKLTGQEHALLVALACSPAPEGRARWSVRLLAEKLTEKTAHRSVSRETVRTSLKKMRSSRG